MTTQRLVTKTKPEPSLYFPQAAAEIPYSFTVELPDTGSSGFILPASQIETVGAELWAATGVVRGCQGGREGGRESL